MHNKYKRSNINYDFYKDIDHEAIEKIAENCSIKDHKECIRLLKKQNHEIVHNIYYKLMYDKDGNETNFIPLGCSYIELSNILVSLGGKTEVYGEKMIRKVKEDITSHEKLIEEMQNKIKNLEIEYFEKKRQLENER